MPDWQAIIYEFFTNPFNQGVMGFIGAIAVIWGILRSLYKKPDQDTPPTTETKCRGKTAYVNRRLRFAD